MYNMFVCMYTCADKGVYMYIWLFVNIWVAPWLASPFKREQDFPETMAIWLCNSHVILLYYVEFGN